jgi:hypothetical protein
VFASPLSYQTLPTLDVFAQSENQSQVHHEQIGIGPENVHRPQKLSNQPDEL